MAEKLNIHEAIAEAEHIIRRELYAARIRGDLTETMHRLAEIIRDEINLDWDKTRTIENELIQYIIEVADRESNRI